MPLKDTNRQKRNKRVQFEGLEAAQPNDGTTANTAPTPTVPKTSRSSLSSSASPAQSKNFSTSRWDGFLGRNEHLQPRTKANSPENTAPVAKSDGEARHASLFGHLEEEIRQHISNGKKLLESVAAAKSEEELRPLLPQVHGLEYVSYAKTSKALDLISTDARLQYEPNVEFRKLISELKRQLEEKRRQFSSGTTEASGKEASTATANPAPTAAKSSDESGGSSPSALDELISKIQAYGQRIEDLSEKVIHVASKEEFLKLATEFGSLNGEISKEIIPELTRIDSEERPSGVKDFITKWRELNARFQEKAKAFSAAKTAAFGKEATKATAANPTPPAPAKATAPKLNPEATEESESETNHDASPENSVTEHSPLSLFGTLDEEQIQGLFKDDVIYVYPEQRKIVMNVSATLPDGRKLMDLTLTRVEVNGSAIWSYPANTTISSQEMYKQIAVRSIQLRNEQASAVEAEIKKLEAEIATLKNDASNQNKVAELTKKLDELKNFKADEIAISISLDDKKTLEIADPNNPLKKIQGTEKQLDEKTRKERVVGNTKLDITDKEAEAIQAHLDAGYKRVQITVGGTIVDVKGNENENKVAHKEAAPLPAKQSNQEQEEVKLDPKPSVYMDARIIDRILAKASIKPNVTTKGTHFYGGIISFRDGELASEIALPENEVEPHAMAGHVVLSQALVAKMAANGSKSFSIDFILHDAVTANGHYTRITINYDPDKTPKATITNMDTLQNGKENRTATEEICKAVNKGLGLSGNNEVKDVKYEPDEVPQEASTCGDRQIIYLLEKFNDHFLRQELKNFRKNRVGVSTEEINVNDLKGNGKLLREFICHLDKKVPVPGATSTNRIAGIFAQPNDVAKAKAKAENKPVSDVIPPEPKFKRE